MRDPLQRHQDIVKDVFYADGCEGLTQQRQDLEAEMNYSTEEKKREVGEKTKEKVRERLMSNHRPLVSNS